MKFMTLKQASEYLGLPISTLRNLSRKESSKKAFHRFDDGRTAPIYCDTEELLRIIRTGKADS